MSNTVLTIRVVCPDVVHPGQDRELYRNNIEVDESLEIPFTILIESFRFLYKKAGTRIIFGYEL